MWVWYTKYMTTMGHTNKKQETTTDSKTVSVLDTIWEAEFPSARTMGLPRLSRGKRVAIALAIVAATCASLWGVASNRASKTENSVEWVTSPYANGREVRLALFRADGDGPHSALLILPGSDGMNDTYLTLGRSFAAQGFDVAVGCWFGLPSKDNSTNGSDCSNAPDFTGVSEESVWAVQALVNATLKATGAAPDRLGILGYSRGGGAALLRSARTGAKEPIVDIAGMVTGQVGGFGTPPPTDVDVIPSAGLISAPTLVLHGASDTIVVPAQSSVLVNVMQLANRDVTVYWYTTECGGNCNHDLLAYPKSRNDVVERASVWLHQQTDG